jgi:pantoate--beta-alanine ligase
MMRIVRTVAEMHREADRLRSEGKKIGLVPTMGYLHDGHRSLLGLAQKECDATVLSVFVNPKQFGPNEDFARYPRDFESDEKLAKNSGVEVLFYPETYELYPDHFSTYVEEQAASRILEGKFRPEHFRGVTTIVAKLFNVCKPHVAVFGQKDAQQAFIVKRMVRDLNFDVSVMVAPIVREADGLAMSSRNVYLSKEERRNATVLHEALDFARRRIEEGEHNVTSLRFEMQAMIQAKGAPSVDYIAFIDPRDFVETESVGAPTILIALAVRFGTTRLIDNAIVSVTG